MIRRFFIALLCLTPWLAQAQLESTSDLQRGLVGWWRFNEGTGTNAFDLSGNANTGTLSGSTLPVWTNGVFGGALSFDGTNAYVSVSISVGLVGNANNATVSLWFKSSSATSQILYAEGNASSTTPNFGILLQSDGTMLGIARDDSSDNGNTTITSSSYNDGKWHSAILVRNTKSSHKLYVDGVSVATNSTTLGTTTLNTTAIGCLHRPTFVDFTHGVIDDVRIYSRALSVTEVLNLYCQGGGRTP